MERVALWLRVSSGGQDEANQLPDLLRYCAARGYEVLPERYTVHAKSAFHGDHQADLDAALTAIRAGKFRTLVIWHSDRLERREGKALLDVLAEFKDAGGRVESVQEPSLGAMDFGGQVTTFIAGLVNHEKSAHLSQQVGLAHDRSRAAGALVGRFPFGYAATGEKYNRQLVVVEETSRLVVRIFEMVIDGLSLRKIADWLNAEGVETLNHGQWSANQIAKLIRNPAYRGQRQYKTHETSCYSPCPAIVSAKVWSDANANLASRPGRGTRPSTKHPEALLKSCLRCVKCDGPMWRLFTRDGAFYRCSGTAAVRRSDCKNMVLCSDADAVVSDFMAGLSEEILTTRLIPGTNHEAELAEVRMAMRDLATRDLPDDEYDSALGSLRAERDRLAALPAVPDSWETVSTGETYAARWNAMDPADRGAWLRVATVRVWAIRADRRPSVVRWGDRVIEPGMTLQSLGKSHEHSGDLPGKIMAAESHGVYALIAWNVETL